MTLPRSLMLLGTAVLIAITSLGVLVLLLAIMIWLAWPFAVQLLDMHQKPEGDVEWIAF